MIFEQATIVRMFPQIVKVDRGVNTAQKNLQFLLIEHPRWNSVGHQYEKRDTMIADVPKPFGVNHLG